MAKTKNKKTTKTVQPSYSDNWTALASVVAANDYNLIERSKSVSFGLFIVQSVACSRQFCCCSFAVLELLAAELVSYFGSKKSKPFAGKLSVNIINFIIRA